MNIKNNFLLFIRDGEHTKFSCFSPTLKGTTEDNKIPMWYLCGIQTITRRNHKKLKSFFTESLCLAKSYKYLFLKIASKGAAKRPNG